MWLLKGQRANKQQYKSLVSCRRQSGVTLQHAKTQKGRLVQTAHAAMHCRVELTNYRLEEAKNDPAEWIGVRKEIEDNVCAAERKKERKEKDCREGWGERVVEKAQHV